MGNYHNNQIDKDIIIKIVKERLLQYGDKKQIFNSLLKLGFSNEEADEIIKTSIKELQELGFPFYKYSNFFILLIILIVILGILLFCCLK